MTINLFMHIPLKLGQRKFFFRKKTRTNLRGQRTNCASLTWLHVVDVDNVDVDGGRVAVLSVPSLNNNIFLQSQNSVCVYFTYIYIYVEEMKEMVNKKSN